VPRKTLQAADAEGGVNPTAIHSSAVVVAACAASAGAHAALVPQHLDHQPRLGVAFIVATLALLGLAAALIHRPTSSYVSHAATLALATLIGAFVVNVTGGITWLSDGSEPTDVVGLATKAVEAVGLGFSIQLNATLGGLGSLTHKEARP
jgi:hypothetical protein